MQRLSQFVLGHKRLVALAWLVMFAAGVFASGIRDLAAARP